MFFPYLNHIFSHFFENFLNYPISLLPWHSYNFFLCQLRIFFIVFFNFLTFFRKFMNFLNFLRNFINYAFHLHFFHIFPFSFEILHQIIIIRIILLFPDEQMGFTDAISFGNLYFFITILLNNFFDRLLSVNLTTPRIILNALNFFL